MEKLTTEMTGKPIGITRKMDELGRLVIPSEIRKSLGIHALDTIEMIPFENGVWIQKSEEQK